jgi:Carboxypeptidase regulatory-like domain
MRLRTVALLYSCLLVACGGSPSAPTTPPAATAMISIAEFTATGELSSDGSSYKPSIQLRETGGRAGATITSFAFTLPGGGSATYTPAANSLRIAAGGTLNVNNITLDSPRATVSSPLSVTVNYTDDSGRSAAASGSTSVRTVQHFSLVGFVRDAQTGRGIQGATVRVTSGPDIGQTAPPTNADGYYAFGALQAGTFTVQAGGAGYSFFNQTVTLSADGQSDFRLTRAPPVVEYRITGTARRCDVTYESAPGSTSQATVDVPWSYTWGSARTGDFLYVSCQISTGGDRGNIKVAIYKNGTLYRSAMADGFPNIATASGTY